MTVSQAKPRVLIIDDNPSIHEDFKKVLMGRNQSQSLAEAANAIFGDDESSSLPDGDALDIELDSALQGEEGYLKTVAAVKEGRPYTLAFCDMRMPPGWDGLTTIEHLWEADPDLQVVICSAYADNSWSEISKRLGRSDRLLILKKPFDNSEVMQLTVALIEKRRLIAAASLKQEELEQLVMERTAQLKERDQALRQKQKLEAVGSLAGGVAHEFNNLLQAIVGYTTFAMEDLPEDSMPYDCLTHVRAATSRATAITGQLVSFSRQQPLQKSVCKSSDIIDTAMALLEPLLSSRIQLNVQVRGEPGSVMADKNHMSQALVNLCTNARDAMNEAGKLSVDLYRQVGHAGESHEKRIGVPAADSTEYAVIAVTDNGSGMSDELIERIFEPFFTTKEVGKGTGLGLWMVFGIIEEHRGFLTVESSEGNGSTFRLYLPMVGSEVDHEPVRAPFNATGVSPKAPLLVDAVPTPFS